MFAFSKSLIFTNVFIPKISVGTLYLVSWMGCKCPSKKNVWIEMALNVIKIVVAIFSSHIGMFSSCATLDNSTIGSLL